MLLPGVAVKGSIMRLVKLIIVMVVALTGSRAMGQSTRPAGSAAPPPVAASPSADQILNQMLQPPDNNKAAALQPQVSPEVSNALTNSVGVDSSSAAILREGTDVIDRVGRLQKTGDGQEEFVFDSDGRNLSDPPLIILQNLKLMSMENAVTAASHDLRFRVTGTVTEYHSRNYILLEKVVVVQDKNQEF
jgi:hypothetical protein